MSHRAVEAHGIDGVIWSDVSGGPRLALFCVLVLSYKACFKSQFQSELEDADCRSYGELSYFTWNLLSKVKKVGDLPEAMDWDSYMCHPSSDFSSIPASDCLKDQAILVSALDDARSSGNKDFYKECHSFICSFIDLLARNVCSTSKLAKGLYSLCPDILFDGDDEYIFRLFSLLTDCLRLSNRIDAITSESACAEFKCLVGELRRGRRPDVAGIKDVFSFLFELPALSSKLYLRNVLQLVCCIALPQKIVLPSVDISLTGAKCNRKILESALVACQSYVLAPKFVSGDLLTKDCVGELKIHLTNAGAFMSEASFAPWRILYVTPRSEIVDALRSLFSRFLAEKVSEWKKTHSLVAPKKSVVAASSSSPVAGSSSVTAPGSSAVKSILASRKSAQIIPPPPSAPTSSFDRSLDRAFGTGDVKGNPKKGKGKGKKDK